MKKKKITSPKGVKREQSDPTQCFKEKQREIVLKRIATYQSETQCMLQFNIAFKPTKLSLAPYDVQHKYRSFDLWSMLNYNADFIVAPEPHANGNVHYHGLIIFIKKKRKYYNESLPALKSIAPNGLKISPVEDLTKCIDYMLKNADDHEYMKNDYLTHNFVSKYVPPTRELPKLSDHEQTVKKIKRLIQYDRKKNKWLIKVMCDKHKQAYKDYRNFKQTCLDMENKLK